MNASYTCPCCGYLEFQHLPGSGETCGICAWIDDADQLANPTVRNGENDCSLSEAQANFAFTIPQPDIDEFEKRGALKDRSWRPLNNIEQEIFTRESKNEDFVNPAASSLCEAYWTRNVVVEKTPNKTPQTTRTFGPRV